MAQSPQFWDPKMHCPVHVANVAAVSGSSAGTYDAGTQTLVTSLKAATVALLAAFKSAGIMAVD